MDTDLQRYSIFSGIFGMVLFFISLLLAQWLPIPAPSMSADEVATMYQANTSMIRLCGTLMATSTFFVGPFYAVVYVQLKRLEGNAHTMAATQLCVGAANLIFFLLPGILICVAAYRPERPVDVTYALNDMVFLVMIMPWQFAAMQAVACGLAIIRSSQKVVIFPRWVAFANFWIALLFVPGTLIPFFKTGPFAWNGLLAFWIPAVVFGGWYLLMGGQILGKLDREPAQQSA